MPDAIEKTTRVEGLMMHRLALLARFVQQTGEYGKINTTKPPKGIGGVYTLAQNFGRRLFNDVLDLYSAEYRKVLQDKLTRERINDISLILDELMDAENIEELLELVKQHKKIPFNYDKKL